MEQAFGIVIFGVVILSTIIAVASLGSSRRAFDEIGANGLNDGTDRPASEPTSGAGFAAVQSDEVRQMLEARNVRRARRGQEPIDVEAELAALLSAPRAVDPGLAGEVRDLVMARNARRVRQGREPLDVDAEVARQLAELG